MINERRTLAIPILAESNTK